MVGIQAITLLSNEGARLMVVINDLPYYQSTGKNSCSAGTWFPCYGVGGVENAILKPETKARSPNIDVAMKKLQTQFDDTNFHQQRNLYVGYEFGRFGNTETLLVSSLLGGNFWESPVGKELIKYLKCEYPKFYEESPTYDIIISDIKLDLKKQANEISEWITKKTNGGTYTSFSQRVNTMSDYDKPAPDIASLIAAIENKGADQSALQQLDSPLLDVHRAYGLDTLCGVAVRSGRIDVISRLCDRVSDVTSLFIETQPETTTSINNFKRFLYHHYDPELMTKLIKMGLKMSTQDLINLVIHGKDESVLFFIRNSIPETINTISYGATPLHTAVGLGKALYVKTLLEQGGNPNHEYRIRVLGKKLPNLVVLALDKEFKEIAMLLLIHGTKTNHPEAANLLDSTKYPVVDNQGSMESSHTSLNRKS